MTNSVPTAISYKYNIALRPKKDWTLTFNQYIYHNIVVVKL